MLCPNCGEDTNPTMKFCQFCNAIMEIDFERVGAALAYESDDAVTERLERKTLGFLLLAVFLLINMIILRVIIDKPVVIIHSHSYSVPKSLANQIKPPEELPLKVKRFAIPEQD
jgi:hypothetical protein